MITLSGFHCTCRALADGIRNRSRSCVCTWKTRISDVSAVLIDGGSGCGNKKDTADTEPDNKDKKLTCFIV